ncbi:MAG: hypothetical protein WDW38_010570 [Sanguina aurantia]
MRWWHMDTGTVNALKTYQACNGLPDTGVCDIHTWKRLLGAEATLADLSLMIGASAGDAEYEDDMTAANTGRVWLLGEQRWEVV